MNRGRASGAVYCLISLAVVITIGPYLWMLLTSLKTQAESIQIPPTIFPQKAIWGNYSALFKTLPFGSFYLNTIISTLFITFGQVIICSLAAYAFARIDFPFKNGLFLIILSILMIPSQLYLIPQFFIIIKMKLANTITALILPGIFSAYGTFLLRQFYSTIPKELEEAAVIDGCNKFQIYKTVIFPLATGGHIALGIITALWAWKSLMWPLIVNTSLSKMTISAGLANLSNRTGVEYPVLMAGAVLGSLPLIILFFLLQKQFIEGVAKVGIKG